ncbi:dimethylaniline monooxygenase (N-oxide-forming) [Epithele typhae]|uniref:dimethylaniline monooxygenase (N-oxide-forming) n=1 Tax=Epithele typhae TaxID=378194 RepID=UPI0020088D93|nr:dimethylaniline monooxygenase (N-oxide-forming) [Epithele typhae]KAH9940017.1 dimethylaniline monooxygenase (N-oxide-forming) [Epithele typhae]
MAALDPHSIATGWLAACSSTLTTGDVLGLTQLFIPDGWLRDLLLFTWDMRSLHGRDNISAYLDHRLSKAQIKDVRLDETQDYCPRTFPIPQDSSAVGVELVFTFECERGHGRGVARLVQDMDGTYRALTVLTQLDDLVGHEERSTLPWRDDVTHEPDRDMQKEFADYVSGIEADPHVLIVGGAQTGLQLAARFKQMGIPALVIERNARVGDTWRARYQNLTLQTARQQHTLLYQPYPANWPEFTPRDKMAQWLELYALSQDIVVWTSTPLSTRPVYDPSTRRWTVTLLRGGTTPVTLRPAHIVLATGTLGAPFVPTLPGASTFRGACMHSSLYPGGRALAGQRVVVVGAGQSGSDIAQDLALNRAGAVTLVQRSTTCVMLRDWVGRQVKGAFPEGVPMAASDLRFAALPLGLMRATAIATQDAAMRDHEELHAKLRKGGVSVDLGPEGQGVYPLVFERYSGMDKGCADHIASGAIQVKALVSVERLTETGVVYSDGTETAADCVILATGYTHMRDANAALFGADLLARTEPDWGLDDEGEIHGAYRACGVPGLWYASGDFSTARIYSKQLALQIKAIELGMMPSDGVREGWKEKQRRG